MSRALFIGRFQPFHNGHLAVVKNILKQYDEIIIAMGSSNEKYTKENPLSYNERKAMIKKTLDSNNIRNYKIIPSPDLYNDVLWVNDIKKRAKNFDVIYSGNPWTIRCFRKHKCKVKKIKLIKGISSTKIREMMVKNKDWKRLVPKEIWRHINEINGIQRIKGL